MNLNETLVAGDLKHLVSSVFEIDSYKSKIGNDQKMVVLSFNVEDKPPADDLARFLELGYDYIVDADATDGPLDTGKYKVFVESFLSLLCKPSFLAISLTSFLRSLPNGNIDFESWRWLRRYKK